jgi:hypothetical protein
MTQNTQTETQPLPTDSRNHKTATHRKIGKTTYIVVASPSEAATDTIYRKIEALILRDVQRSVKAM